MVGIIYFVFDERERMELEELLYNKLNSMNDLKEDLEIKDKRSLIKMRALKEKREILIRINTKVSKEKKKL